MTQQLVCLVVEVSLFLELVEASEDDREAEVPRTAVHLDHPRSHGLTTRTAKYIIITICLLLLRYYATREWCGECSIAWHGSGAGPGWCWAGESCRAAPEPGHN